MQTIIELFHSHWMYALFLLVSLGGLVFLDFKYSLVAFPLKNRQLSSRTRAALATIGAMVALFILWDISGIVLGIFRTNPRYTIGLNLFTPNFPIEEILFLILLSYVSLLTYKGLGPYIKKRMQP